jgi:hypothetical protein
MFAVMAGIMGILRDDEILQLICPTCQSAFVGSPMSATARLTLHGVVFDILVGGLHPWRSPATPNMSA